MPRPLLALSQRLESALVSFLKGEEADFSFLTLNLNFSPFRNRIYKELTKTRRGEVLTYQELAKRGGNPLASRAVGTAMAQNPYPIIIPCHRIVPSGFHKNSGAQKDFGAYSGPGSSQTKMHLLKLEGVIK